MQGINYSTHVNEMPLILSFGVTRDRFGDFSRKSLTHLYPSLGVSLGQKMVHIDVDGIKFQLFSDNKMQ